MKFNTIYFFDYEKEGDISQFKKEISLEELERVSIEKDGFSLYMQLVDKILIVHFKFNWEVLMWYEGIKNATELSFMIMRSRSKNIKYDIGKIY